MTIATPTTATAETGPRRGRVLSHPEDLHCVVYHLLVLAAYPTAFWIYLHPDAAGLEGRWEMAAFIAAAAWMLGWISGIDVGVNYHNHAHLKVFRSRFLNRWFGRLWTFSGGWPDFFWKFSHVSVHHSRVLEPDDWTLPRRDAEGRWEGYHSYAFLHWPWRYAIHFWREFRRYPKLARRATRELVIFLALWSIPFWIDPWMAVWLWVLPQWIGNVFFLAPGMYVQHVRCVPKTPTKPFVHSNTYLSRFFNLTMFNIGYHMEHHDHPAVHWSELPVLHVRLREEMVEGGTRVLTSGYYRAAFVYGTAVDPGKADRDFEAMRHPDYALAPALEPSSGGAVPELAAPAD